MRVAARCGRQSKKPLGASRRPDFATSSRRLRTPTLSKIDFRWSWTVWTEMESCAAIWAVEKPWQTSPVLVAEPERLDDIAVARALRQATACRLRERPHSVGRARHVGPLVHVGSQKLVLDEVRRRPLRDLLAIGAREEERRGIGERHHSASTGTARRSRDRTAVRSASGSRPCRHTPAIASARSFLGISPTRSWRAAGQEAKGPRPLPVRSPFAEKGYGCSILLTSVT